MTDPIEKRDPTPIVVTTSSETDYTLNLTHRTDMTELAYRAVVEPVKFTQIGQTVRSLLGVLVILAALILRRDLPESVLIALIIAGATIGVTNGDALTKLIDKFVKQR